MSAADIQDVLCFWFEECTPAQWFKPDPAFDHSLCERFERLYERAAAGACDDWAETPEGVLALVIVLDQFPRNMFRASPKAFATDAMALALAETAIDGGLDLALPVARRKFLYMPFQHSERLRDQERSVRLVDERCDDADTLDYARRHLDVVARFGRFPHRNAILGRENTPEETEFLSQPGSSF